MAKPSRIYSADRIEREFDEIEQTVSVEEWVTLRNLIDARVVVSGDSGRRYEFPRAGAEVKVLKSDSQRLLEHRRLKEPCCGGRGNHPMFELV